MKGRTRSTWQRGCVNLCVCAVLVLSGLNSSSASTLAAPTPTNTSAAVAAKLEYIAQTILSLQQSQQRWIEVNLQEQRLIAWEGEKPVYTVRVSTGKPATPTPTGTFTIQSKLRLTRMQGADYDVPDVPYTMYYEGNYAIHGAYWHNNFGTPVSHGCVNVAPDQALWLFNWAAIGTPVVVHE